jgi:hypothetical protein
LEKDVSDKFVIPDHRIPARSRGTWCSARSGEWYELDYFIVS